MMQQAEQNATYWIVFVSTFVLPMIMISLFLLRKVIKSLEMTETQERFVHFLVTAIFYFFSYFTLYKLHAPGFISAYILGAFIIVFLISFITIKWKISAHAAGLGGLIGMMLALANLYFASTIFFFAQALIVTGLVASSRLILEEHNLKQVAAGFLMGVGVMLSTIYFYPI
ncbi:MAG: hypothetical protein C0599_12380 [Salinivirgaceae bacterium]|nr:MAG: hypothetical protein C0599_12380 [Salinivirgaceae bacterium]